MRVGIGYDVHRLVKNRDLILGGEKVEYHLGLAGHSDADVLVHAIMDALLGAIAQRDIGRHFPDSGPQYKNISSLLLLEKVSAMVAENGYAIGNIDCIIVAEQPKLSPYIPEMVRHLAETMALAESQINIKATTTEGLGFTGLGRGIAAHAVAVVYKKQGLFG